MISTNYEIKQNPASSIAFYSGCLLFFIHFLTTSSAIPSEAELSHLVIKNTRDALLIDLKVKGVFTEEMKEAVQNGTPVTLLFSFLLFEVRNYWFDLKMVSKTVIHNVKFDVLKKEYKIRRSWGKKDPFILKDYQRVQRLISEIKGLEIIPVARLKRETQYQMRVKSELKDQKSMFLDTSWGFETDWYTINFIY